MAHSTKQIFRQLTDSFVSLCEKERNVYMVDQENYELGKHQAYWQNY